MDIGFVWDEDKYSKVTQDHNVIFWEVVSAFDDDHAYEQPDPYHEDRMIMIAKTHSNRLLYIVYTDEEMPLYRIITAFDATGHWEDAYHGKI